MMTNSGKPELVQGRVRGGGASGSSIPGIVRLAITLFAGVPLARTPVLLPIFALGRVSMLVVIFGVMELVCLRRLRDDAVEPFTDGHTGAPCSLTRGLARLPRHAAQLPRRTRFHARILN
jgi:hypothetical protein